MNVLMPSPAAPTLDAATALLPVAPATLPGLSTTPPFDLALQRLLGGSALSDVPADGADSTDDTDDAPTLPDLLVSGLLQQAPGMPVPPDAQPALTSAPAPAPAVGTAAATPLLAALATAPAALPQPAPLPTRTPAAALPATALPAPLPTEAAAATQPASARAVHALQAIDVRTAAAPQEQRPAPLADFALPPVADATLQAPQPGSSALLAPELGSRAATATGQAMSAAAPQPLLDALGERIALQMQRGSERVVIRLDPPMQGQIEISIRTDASGTTQVHLSGSSGELTRQLHAISDSLRQELVQRQPGEVSVQVSHGMREQGERQRQERQFAEQAEPGRALDEDRDPDLARQFALAADQDSR